jgi:hypothetical protein
MKVAIPHKAKPIAQKQTGGRCCAQRGVVIPVDRFSWLTDGPVKSIETGLPLLIDCNLAQPLLVCDQVEKDIEQARFRLLEGFVDASDHLDPFPMEANEVADTHEHLEYKRLHDKICRKKQRRIDRPPTGIIRRPPADDLIDNIGRVHIRSARTPRRVDAGADPFPSPKHPDPPARIPPARATTQLVKSHMARVFRPGCEPFRDVDCEDDFATGGLYAPRSEADAAPGPEAHDEEHQSILVDASQFDIFWTRHRAPFTREEVEMIQGWRESRLERMRNDDGRTQRLLDRRERSMGRTFQSRMAFEHELDLADRECDKVANLGPGKGPRPKQSTWEMAARTAAADPSSLPYRKSCWAAFVGRIARYGFVSSPTQEKLALEFRRQLLSGRVVGPALFWDTIAALGEMEFGTLEVMVTIDCIRDGMDVPMEEWIAYMKKNTLSVQLYNVALDEIEIREGNRIGRPRLVATTRTPKKRFGEAPHLTKQQKAATARADVLRPVDSAL